MPQDLTTEHNIRAEDLFRNNPKLKRVGVKIAWDEHRLKELVRCSEDPLYFIENYVQIVNLDEGLIPFKPHVYQREMIENLHNDRFNIFATCRQAGKTTCVAAYIVWYLLFAGKLKTVAILANKEDTAIEILDRVQLIYTNLPSWLQQGIKTWGKTEIVLENGCVAFASATSSDAIRGYSINMLFIDEVAHIENWDKFYTAVYSTVTSGKTTKVTLVSTPNGLNHFYKFWNDSEEGKNKFKRVKVTWRDVPGRDQEWYEETLGGMNNNIEKFEQEHEVAFLGSSGTLIAGWKLRELSYKTPLYVKEGLSIFEYALPNHMYMIMVDTSRGKALDYSAFSVIDVTTMPYQQVCTYRDNNTTPLDYSRVVYETALRYNRATLLVEINDLGGQVSDAIVEEYEYEAVLATESAGKAGKRVSSRIGSSKSDNGVRTTKTVKRIGCSVLKLLIEGNQLIINDFHTIEELSRFSAKRGSYEAELGAHDDLVMGLVLFGWLSSEKYFRELTDINTLEEMRERTQREIEESILPIGFKVTGHESHFDHESINVVEQTDQSFESWLLS